MTDASIPIPPAANPAPTPPSTPAKPDLVGTIVKDVQQVEVAIENVVHTVIVKVEAGWTWVEGEFVHLAAEAKAAYAWVQNEDPQLAAYVRQLFLTWEGKAASAAQAGAGAFGNIIANEGATIETGVANFVQGILGANLGGATSKEAIAYLFSKGEGVLQNLISTGLAKVIGGLLASKGVVGG